MMMMILISTAVDCGIPEPPVNGYLGNYTGRKLSDIVTVQCGDGYIPSMVMVSTCMQNGLWTPQPSDHNCTLVVGM